MSAPRNTTHDVSDAAGAMAFIAASSGPNGVGRAIEEQESSGSAQLRASTVLPTQGSENPEFLQLGFTFGEQTHGDPIFREATLPPGWSKQPGEDSRQTYVVDERGIRRVSIFYKAAFYDRYANMHLVGVGEAVATEWIYGTSPTLVLHPDLTDDELQAVHDSAGEYLDQAVEHPRIYGDRKPRAIEIYQVARVELERRKNTARTTRRRTGGRR